MGLDDISADGARLLEPYAGRGVLNAGAVSFHGVVDDYLYRAYRALDDPDATRWRQATVIGYTRIGATWWRERVGEPSHYRGRTDSLLSNRRGPVDHRPRRGAGRDS